MVFSKYGTFKCYILSGVSPVSPHLKMDRNVSCSMDLAAEPSNLMS